VLPLVPQPVPSLQLHMHAALPVRDEFVYGRRDGTLVPGRLQTLRREDAQKAVAGTAAEDMAWLNITPEAS
jgi:hypothetical protein